MKEINLKLKDEVVVLFKDGKNNEAKITITVQKLLESTTDDLYCFLEETESCQGNSCYTEGQNYCDCEPIYEDYEIYSIQLTI